MCRLTDAIWHLSFAPRGKAAVTKRAPKRHRTRAGEATTMTPSPATTELSDDWISAGAACALLGDSKVKVLNAVIAGRLDGKWVAGRTIVRRDSVEAEIARRQ